MKKLECFLGMVFSALFMYSFIEVLFIVSGNLEFSPTFLVPFRINYLILVVAMLLSGICSVIFPLWDVGKHLMTQNVPIIENYKRSYRVDYIFIFLGYIGLVLWIQDEHVFDAIWWIGTVFLLLYFTHLILWPFINKANK
jgi:hypothetical protein